MVNELDNELRYTPSVVMTLKGRRPVVRVGAYPPGTHPPKCPLVATCTAVELVTDIGTSRWYGVVEARINSELRMVVTGFPALFEEMRAWEKCKTV